MNVTPTPYIFTLSLHDALPIWTNFHPAASASAFRRLLQPFRPSLVIAVDVTPTAPAARGVIIGVVIARSEEHTSELQSHVNLVCRLLLEKKNHADYFVCFTIIK